MAFPTRNNFAVENNIQQGIATSKTLLADSSSIDCSNGKSCYAKHNHLSINEYKTNQKENNHLRDKGERWIIKVICNKLIYINVLSRNKVVLTKKKKK